MQGLPSRASALLSALDPTFAPSCTLCNSHTGFEGPWRGDWLWRVDREPMGGETLTAALVHLPACSGPKGILSESTRLPSCPAPSKLDGLDQEPLLLHFLISIRNLPLACRHPQGCHEHQAR